MQNQKAHNAALAKKIRETQAEATWQRLCFESAEEFAPMASKERTRQAMVHAPGIVVWHEKTRLALVAVREHLDAFAERLEKCHRKPAKKEEAREFPKFKPGMSTAEYIEKFAFINGGKCCVLPIDLSLHATPAPTYENGALDFDVIEEVESEAHDLPQSEAKPDTAPANTAPVATETAAKTAQPQKLPPTDIRVGDKVVVDGEAYTVIGPLKEGKKSVGVVASRDSDTNPLAGVRQVFLRGDAAIVARIAAQQAQAAIGLVAPPVPAEKHGLVGDAARSNFNCKKDEGATMPANTAQDFAQDIPATLAEQAFNGTSFSPEKRGQSARDGYAQDMAQALEELTRHATKGCTLDILPSVFAQYRARQSSAYRAYLASSSRCVSSFIAGPSNFPAARMNKRADIAHKRFNEYYDGGKAAMRRAIKELRPDLRPIMAGDADAVERLQKEIDKAERVQVLMKSANAAIRKHAKAGEAHQVAALMELGLTEAGAVEFLRPDYAGRIGAPAYALSNNSANIRRMKERLEKITSAKAQPVTQLESASGITLEDDAPANRVRLFFPGKPSEEIRADLKSSGFRWAPSLGAWQAYRNRCALETAKRLAGAPVASEATEPEAPEAAPISCTNFEQKTEISAPAPAPEAVQPEESPASAPAEEVGGVEGASRSNLESEPVAYQWPDVLALTVEDVQAMPDSIYAQHLDKLEDINHHAEALMLECLRAGQIVLAQAIAHLVRYQTSPDYRGLTGDYCDARMHISAKLHGFAAPRAMTPEAQALLTDWGLGHWLEAPQPPSAPASPEFAQRMAQARSARSLAREAIARAKVSSRATTPPDDDPTRAFSHLVPITQNERQKGGTGAAPNIRRHLKNQFPGVKFSVTSDYSSANIKWTDGPTTEDVDAALAGFDIGRSDSMTDYFYTEKTEFSEIFGGVQYIFTNRAISDDLLARALLNVFGPNGPSVADFRASKAWIQVKQGTHKGCQMSQYEWMSLAENHARKI